jgi:hypothetical protein
LVSEIGTGLTGIESERGPIIHVTAAIRPIIVIDFVSILLDPLVSAIVLLML